MVVWANDHLHDLPLLAEAVEELFSRVHGATMIQERVHFGNNDSRSPGGRLFYCATSALSGVLQQLRLTCRGMRQMNGGSANDPEVIFGAV